MRSSGQVLGYPPKSGYKASLVKEKPCRKAGFFHFGTLIGLPVWVLKAITKKLIFLFLGCAES